MLIAIDKLFTLRDENKHNQSIAACLSNIGSEKYINCKSFDPGKERIRTLAKQMLCSDC